MTLKRFNRIKKLYNQNILEELLKTADSKEEEVNELAKQLNIKDEPQKPTEKSKYVEPVVPHRIDPQLTLFPTAPAAGTEKDPKKYTPGEIMGRICPICGFKNFPVWIKQCERCARLYKRMDNLVEHEGFTKEEAVELVGKENRSFIGPTALKKIYESGGKVALPEEVKEITFRDRRGLAGTPNMLKLKNVLDTNFNVKKDQFGEPIFDKEGMPIPLERKDKTHFPMDELSKKMLLSNDVFLRYIDNYNEKNPDQKRVGPSYGLNDELQIFNWKDVKPAFTERMKELRTDIFPKKQIERLQQKAERLINRVEEIKKTIIFWESKKLKLKEDYLEDRHMFKMFQELNKLRKFKIKNKRLKSLERTYGPQLDKYINDMTRLNAAIERSETHLDEERENMLSTKNEFIHQKQQMGQPIPEETLTLLNLEEAQEGLDTDQLAKQLMGEEKTSRMDMLHSLLKQSDEPFQLSMFDRLEKKRREKEFEESLKKTERGQQTREELDLQETKILNLMKIKNMSREEATKIIEDAGSKFLPPKQPFFPPKERKQIEFSERECPYCSKKQIFEGAEHCSSCKFPVEEGKRYIVVKKKLWAMAKDKNGNIIINEDTGKPKRRPIPFTSLVTVTLDNNGTPVSANVKKVTVISADMSAKTLEERTETYKKDPKINPPGPITRKKEDFRRETESGDIIHKQQMRGCPPPWVNIPSSNFKDYKETETALAHIVGDSLPNSTEAWDLEEVANIKDPVDKRPFNQGPTLLPLGNSRLETIYKLSIID